MKNIIIITILILSTNLLNSQDLIDPPKIISDTTNNPCPEQDVTLTFDQIPGNVKIEDFNELFIKNGDHYTTNTPFATTSIVLFNSKGILIENVSGNAFDATNLVSGAYFIVIFDNNLK